jgi:glucose-1-phosphate thymidylyltransferase
MRGDVADRQWIGLIPTAGQAKRLSPLPFSKEVYPLGFTGTEASQTQRPKVVCEYLLEAMRCAEIRRAFLILRSGKWDIPAYLGDGEGLGMHLGYLIMGLPYGVPFTLNQAYPFIRDAHIALGFPDILFSPRDAFCHLQATQAATQADVVLGVVPAQPKQVGGMVAMDAAGTITEVIEKPAHTDLTHSWFNAVWAPTFSEFLHQYLQAWNHEHPPEAEIPMGNVIHAAIGAGLKVKAHVFAQGSYLDIGIPANLMVALGHQLQAITDYSIS